jgi:hypothetical protein
VATATPKPGEQLDFKNFCRAVHPKTSPKAIFYAAFTLVRTLRSRCYSIEISSVVHRHRTVIFNDRGGQKIVWAARK